MANTTIQVKRSTVTNTSTNGSLAAGEPAYSYSSNVMFMGTSDGAGVLAIGGRFYVEKTNSAYDIAQAAYSAANSAGSSESLGNIYTQANNSFNAANAAFNKANSANVLAYDTSLVAAASYVFANSAHLTANSAFNNSNASFNAANAAFNKANLANIVASSAYDNSNTKFSSSGGSITGDVAITGSLTVTGNVFSLDTTTLRVDDPLIYLAANNYTSDIVDIGFIGNYSNATGANVHTGLYREHTNKEYYLFQGYDAEPINNHIGALSNNMTLSVLNADIRTSNLNLGGTNAIIWITSSFDKANASGVIGSAAFDKANTANVNAANASFFTTGVVALGFGGTGRTTFTTNGILYGNTSGPLNITSAGTEGQVLQAGATGIPSFAMLDGGTF